MSAGKDGQLEIWLPLVDAFRTFCLQPDIEGKQLFAQISGFKFVNGPFAC